MSETFHFDGTCGDRTNTVFVGPAGQGMSQPGGRELDGNTFGENNHRSDERLPCGCPPSYRAKCENWSCPSR